MKKRNCANCIWHYDCKTKIKFINNKEDGLMGEDYNSNFDEEYEAENCSYYDPIENDEYIDMLIEDGRQKYIEEVNDEYEEFQRDWN